MLIVCSARMLPLRPDEAQGQLAISQRGCGCAHADMHVVLEALHKHIHPAESSACERRCTSPHDDAVMLLTALSEAHATARVAASRHIDAAHNSSVPGRLSRGGSHRISKVIEAASALSEYLLLPSEPAWDSRLPGRHVWQVFRRGWGMWVLTPPLQVLQHRPRPHP